MERTTRLLAVIALCCFGREALADYRTEKDFPPSTEADSGVGLTPRGRRVALLEAYRRELLQRTNLTPEQREAALGAYKSRLEEAEDRFWTPGPAPEQQKAKEKQDIALLEIQNSQPARLRAVFSSIITAKKVSSEKEATGQVRPQGDVRGRGIPLRQLGMVHSYMGGTGVTSDGLLVEICVVSVERDGSRTPYVLTSYLAPINLLKTQGFTVIYLKNRGLELLDLQAWEIIKESAPRHTAPDALVKKHRIDTAAKAAYEIAMASVEMEKDSQAALELFQNIQKALGEPGQ